ncbi:MAG: hypothetical protein LBD11_08395 [Candidatus Peribacteria bacterium]|jgi:hypothetical protein|nr:hypothetical protein [Candidatus Peribacteria bacterium]
MGKTNKTIDDVVPGLDKVSNTLIPSNGSIIGKVGDNSIIFEKLPNSESFSLALKN